MKYKILLLIMFTIVLSSLTYADTVVNSHGEAFGNQNSQTIANGIAFIPNQDINLTICVKSNLANPTTCGIRRFDSDYHFANATFTGDNATFSTPISLNASTEYCIFAWSSGASYTQDRSGSANYIYEEQQLNYTRRCYDLIAYGDDTAIVHNIVSLVTTNGTVVPPVSEPYHNVKITNMFNNSVIAGVNITLNNSVSNLTQADGIAYFGNFSGSYDFTGTLTDYFSITGTALENQTVTYNMTQSQINFSCFEKITNNSLTCINGTIYPNADNYNFTIGVNGYYDVTQAETITALDNKTINITGFYTSNITFINNFIGGVGNSSTQCNYTITTISGNYTEIVSGPNGTNAGLINGTYNLTTDCLNYAYTYQNFTVNATAHNVTIDLYPSNSIDIFIYDETSGILLNGTNITIIKTLGVSQSLNYTSTGTISYTNLTAGNYTFSFYGDDYPSRSYSVVIGNKTYQTLNVYLLANTTDAVIFTFEKYSSSAIIEGVTFQISKIINGSDTILTVLTSDVTGRVQFYFDNIEQYCFVASKSGYTTKQFCLNPIIFNSYTIKLVSSVNLSTGNDYEGLLIDYVSPFRYWNNQNNTVTFSFASPKGDLTNYGYNVTYNHTTITKTDTNAFGSILTGDLEILNAVYGDQVILYHWYKKATDTEYHIFKSIYDIYGYNATSQSLTDNPPGDYGLGEFEKTLMSTMITLLVAGAGALYGGAIAGGLLGLFMFGWLMYVGFLSFWVGIISIILLFIIVAWSGSK